jgi:thioredoxin 1
MSEKSPPIVLTEKNFETEVLEFPDLVLVEFIARWSGSCKIIASVINQVSEDFRGQIKLGTLDVDDNERLARDYRIQNLPTLLFFRHGVVVDHIAGTFPRKTVVNKLKSLLATRNDKKD